MYTPFSHVAATTNTTNEFKTKESAYIDLSVCYKKKGISLSHTSNKTNEIFWVVLVTVWVPFRTKLFAS